jgi:glutaredoxin-related protein
VTWIDRARARAHAALDKLPGKLGDAAKRANVALGRPLANADELADRRAFAHRSSANAPMPKTAAPAPAATPEVAPVIVYHMDKTRRDAQKLVDMLNAEGIPHQVSNIQEDPAAQMAVRRDSKGFRLPVVFVAGEAIGGRAELSNLIASGDLKKTVFGAG